MQSREVWRVVMLGCVNLCLCKSNEICNEGLKRKERGIDLDGNKILTYDSTNLGIPSKSVTSNWKLETFSLPCFSCRESRCAWRRPTAMT